MKNTTKELIVETLNGNDKAYEKIYNVYKEKISGFLFKNYPYNNEHEDDTAEIIYRVFKKLESYDSDKSKFDTWVIMIAKNYMIDKSRKKNPIYVSFTSNTFAGDDFSLGANSPTTSGTLNMIEPTSYLNSPHDTLEYSDSLSFLSNKMEKSDFSMFTMNSEGYSYNEIAEEFGSNSVKISNKLNYVKSKIKKDE